jgi:carbon-monoxide dehydrogenase medium subunit
VELQLPPDGTGHGFCEVAGRADDFATAAATALLTIDDRGACERARIGLAGIADRPVRCAPAEELCTGERLEDELLLRLATAVTDAVSPEDDAFISGAYRARAAGTCAARAVESAWKRAMGEAG